MLRCKGSCLERLGTSEQCVTCSVVEAFELLLQVTLVTKFSCFRQEEGLPETLETTFGNQ